MSAQKHTVLLKLLLLGDASVGKTSVFNRYVKDSYSEVYKATIGADFYSKTLQIDDKEVILQIWDTAGQERFHSLGPSFFRGSDACILVYDITNQRSFEALSEWVEQFTSGVGVKNQNIKDSDYIFLVLGNKCDLDEERQVSKDVAKQYCEANGFHFLETSAKNGFNVNDAFEYISRRGITMIEQQAIEIPNHVLNIEHTDDVEAVATQGGCSC